MTSFCFLLIPGARLSCGCCGKPNYKDMEFRDYDALVQYASLLNTIIMELGIANHTKDARVFSFDATPSLHAAFEIVENTMKVKRKALVRRSEKAGTIALTAPAEFRGTFLLLMNRVESFRAALSSDVDLWNRYGSMLKELAAVIRDEIEPFRQGAHALPAVFTPVIGRKRKVHDFDFPNLSPESCLSKSLQEGDVPFEDLMYHWPLEGLINNVDFSVQHDASLSATALEEDFDLMDDAFKLQI